MGGLFSPQAWAMVWAYRATFLHGLGNTVQLAAVGLVLALALGFGYLGRMYYVILPQSVKIILPPMVNQVVNLIKNTSCLYIVGGADLISVTYNFVTGVNTGGAYAPAYIVSGLLFFVVCFPLSTLASVWETALKKRDARTTAARIK